MYKNKLFLQLIVLFFILAPMAFVYSSDKIREGNVDSQEEFGPWIKHGKLVFHYSIIKGKRTGVYMYQCPDGTWITLQKNIKCINELFKNEINTSEVINGFLNTQLTRFLLSTMTPGDCRLIEGSTVSPEYYIPTNKYDIPISLTKEEQEVLRSKLASYVLNNIPLIKGSQWSFKVCVLTNNGGVETWAVKGLLSPFQIQQFNRQQVEKDGTFASIRSIK